MGSGGECGKLKGVCVCVPKRYLKDIKKIYCTQRYLNLKHVKTCFWLSGNNLAGNRKMWRAKLGTNCLTLEPEKEQRGPTGLLSSLWLSDSLLLIMPPGPPPAWYWSSLVPRVTPLSPKAESRVGWQLLAYLNGEVGEGPVHWLPSLLGSPQLSETDQLPWHEDLRVEWSWANNQKQHAGRRWDRCISWKNKIGELTRSSILSGWIS